MDKDKIRREYVPLETKSRILSTIFYNLDEELVEIEESLEYYKTKAKEYEKKYNEQIHELFLAQQRNMGATLQACLGYPKPEDLGTVGMTVLIKILNMDTIEQVKEYAKGFIDANKKDKKNLENSEKV